MSECTFNGPDYLDYSTVTTPACCQDCGGEVEWHYYSVSEYSASKGPIRVGRKRLVCVNAGGYPRSTGVTPRATPKGAGIWDD